MCSLELNINNAELLGNFLARLGREPYMHKMAKLRVEAEKAIDGF